MKLIHYTPEVLTLNDMEHHIILFKLIIIPVIGSISMKLMNSVSPFAIVFYCTATAGVVYTIIAPYHRKRNPIDVFYFPVWWYTKGFIYAMHKLVRYIKSGNEYLAPGLWLKNIFVPI